MSPNYSKSASHTCHLKPTRRILGFVSLLALMSICSSSVDAFMNGNLHRHKKSPLSVLQDASQNDQAQKLMDRAAQLRAEIAAMEGKTVDQVEAEAKEKKEGIEQRRQQQQQQALASKSSTDKNQNDSGSRFVNLPETMDDMIRQAARSVERAFKDGKTRQTVRFNLISEDQPTTEENEFPGGARQMYRESGKPLTTALLKELRLTIPSDDDNQHNNNRNPLPATIKSQDIWDFDGSALHTAEAAEGTIADIQALVFANTDTKYIDDIQEISNAMGPKRLFLLVNPFWRNVESWGFNLLAPKAKSKAQAVIFDQGYDETYSLMVFQVRGEKCAAVKAYPYDWQIFGLLEIDNDPWNREQVIRLGSIQEDPTSAVVTEMINARPEFRETKAMRQFKGKF